MDAAIRTEHLTKVFGGVVIAVNDLCLTVPKGAVFGFLGPNGAGKTTTLRLLLGLHRPTAGGAFVFGRPCGVGATDVRGMIGFLPTNPKFPPHLKPFEYLNLVGKLHRIPAEVRMPRISSLIRAVGLLSVTDQRIGTLSTGETTRLGIAASLLADPPLLLWDEPTAGLDPAARRFALDLIQELRQERTVVVATHILADIDRVCDHVGVMHEGQMIFCGTMQEMKRRLRHDGITLELAGSNEALRKAAETLAERCPVEHRWLGENVVSLTVEEGRGRAAVLAEVLQVLNDVGVDLQAIQSGHGDTEGAYLNLLQEDLSHGFARFQDSPRPTHADRSGVSV
ncbi:MAG: ABC transporter ATP-binding protein [Thermogutta sp.]|nr:ABC transporter ATP-binding protein [Thermogutta sp.]